MNSTRRFRLLLLLLAAFAFPTAADYGPNGDNNGGDNGGGGLGEAFGDGPAVNANKMAVPDFIKPGARFLYTSSSSSENTDPKKNPSAGQGYNEYTVIAITKDKVYVIDSSYLAVNGLPLDNSGKLMDNTDPKVILMGGSYIGFTKQSAVMGEALWMPVDQLKAIKKTKTIDVIKGPHPYKGEGVVSTTYGVFGKDSIIVKTFRNDNGMKLVDRSYTGPIRRGGGNQYNRRHQNQMYLIDHNQSSSPLLGSAWMTWKKNIKSMTYAGTYRMQVQGAPELPPTRMSMVIKFTERGPDYALGTVTNQMTGGDPVTSPFAQGPGTHLGYYVDPKVLANLKQGTLEQNKYLFTTLTYKVQEGDLGKLGVFMLTNKTNSFYAVSGYNLESGALTYMRLYHAQTNTTTTFTLQNVEMGQ